MTVQTPDPKTPDPSGKILPIRFGDMQHPAICFNCRRIGKNKDEIFADPQTYFEWEGSIYICEDCVTEFGSIFGMVTKSHNAHSLANRDALIRENIELNSRLREIEATVDYLTSLRLIERGILKPDLSSYRYVVDAETLEQLVPQSKEDDSGSVEQQPESDQSSSIDGPFDIDELTSIDPSTGTTS